MNDNSGRKKLFLVLKVAGILCFFLLLAFLLSFLQPGGDWTAVLRPSTRALLNGKNPYDEMRFLSPPWAFLFLIPPALLSPALGSILFALIGAAGYFLAFNRLKVKPLTALFLIFNPAFLAVLFNPNFDWTVALGFTLPPPIGLFFVLTKPQISAPLVLYWLVDAWRSGGFRRVLRVFAPVILVYVISFLIFGPWILHFGGALSSLSNTANVWPYGLLVGFVLVVASLRMRKPGLSLSAGPFFSPYLAPYSWLPAILGLLPEDALVIAACIALWVAFLISQQVFGI